MAKLDEAEAQGEKYPAADQQINEYRTPDEIVYKINETYHAYPSVRINILATLNSGKPESVRMDATDACACRKRRGKTAMKIGRKFLFFVGIAV
ncbi:hypothetical protein [Enterovibrio paralichthyis]|uniref:hypothetical protein n=1 Tax=Enterovibrio paralichthyis TaxID=2853805 RepID=UPI001C476496|nr:hypothetical protein [Enterovibrio paralichthyis]MBV7299977.1 hypothetical protein [Enterovibrio paralichthyis]